MGGCFPKGGGGPARPSRLIADAGRLRSSAQRHSLRRASQGPDARHWYDPASAAPRIHHVPPLRRRPAARNRVISQGWVCTACPSLGVRASLRAPRQLSPEVQTDSPHLQ
jgi:hypothetical protein